MFASAHDNANRLKTLSPLSVDKGPNNNNNTNASTKVSLLFCTSLGQ